MLENRGKQLIINKKYDNLLEDIKSIKEEKRNRREKDLKSYLKEKQEEEDNTMTKIDTILYSYLKEEIKEKLEKS